MIKALEIKEPWRGILKNDPDRVIIACEHDWQIWPETDGLEQRCSRCGAYRPTPTEDQFWRKD